MTTPYAEVIGDPIAHSKSPLIHRFWLQRLGIDADYSARQVAAEDLADYFAQRREDPAWRGCNVTLPHKVMALSHVADPGGIRDTIGAINTAFRSDDGQVIGTNTDAAGFYAPLAEVDLAGQPVAVVGSGGAARAVLYALARMEVGPVTLLARDALGGAGLLHRFGLRGEVKPLAAPVPAVALLVNASTLGMAGAPPLELDLSHLPEDAIVYDIVYTPLETNLLAAARVRELATIDGLEMLIAQAAVAFELFFGQTPPRDADDELRALLTA
jgi:shikimate dehydrogenase